MFDDSTENLGEERGTDIESDTDGSVGYDDVGEDHDVLDRELHTLAKEGHITYAPSMSQLPRASLNTLMGSLKRAKSLAQFCRNITHNNCTVKTFR